MGTTERERRKNEERKEEEKERKRKRKTSTTKKKGFSYKKPLRGTLSNGPPPYTQTQRTSLSSPPHLIPPYEGRHKPRRRDRENGRKRKQESLSLGTHEGQRGRGRRQLPCSSVPPQRRKTKGKTNTTLKQGTTHLFSSFRLNGCQTPLTPVTLVDSLSCTALKQKRERQKKH